MKAGFSLTKRFVPTWADNDKLNGADQCVAVLSMPTTADVFDILERLRSSGVDGKVDDQEQKALGNDIVRARTLLIEAGKYIPQYVKLENAEDFSIEDVVKYPPYYPLAVELLFALVKFSQPTEADTKNS